MTGISGGRGQAIGLAVPLLLLNGFAAWGQQEWATKQMHWWAPFAWVLAFTLETIGAWLSHQADLRMRMNEPGLGLRAAAYSIAALIGTLNYDHFANGWVPNREAIVFFGMSMGSPWLWGIHSKTRSRAVRAQLGLVDARSVHFSMARWFWHPYRTFRVFWDALWAGVTSPEVALALFDPVKRQNGHAKTDVPGLVRPR